MKNHDFQCYQQQLIGDIWTSDEPYRNLEELCDVIGSRWAGSDSEHQAGEYLKAKLELYGLRNVRLEPVTFGAWTRGQASLTLTQPAEHELSCISLPYCPAGEIEAELIDAGNGESSDFERLGDATRGKIIIAAGETNPSGTQYKKLAHRTDKLRYAVDAGAVGIIFVNQNPGLLHVSGGIASAEGGPAEIMGLGTSWEHGQKLLRLVKHSESPVVAKITVEGTFFTNTSYNVIGDIPGSQYGNELVVAGAHYDGHDISQAALDDGCGTMVALESARVLAALPPEAIGRTIRFILFCGEEVGMFGSWAYTAEHQSESQNTRFMLNLDGAGRGKGGSESLIVSGRPELLSYFDKFIAESHYQIALSDGLSPHSDHFPYAIRGIPTASLKSPDDSSNLVGRGWGHTEADTFDKARLRGLQMASMVAARLLLTIASDGGFPGTMKSQVELQQQLLNLGLDVALKRSGRWNLVGTLS